MDLLLSMEAFCRVAETGSMTTAARRLGVAKSVVTTRVQQLEERLGVPLFHRSSRAMKLSETGGKYYTECQEILARAEALTSRSQTADKVLSGTLFIQVLPGFALSGFSKALAEFSALHPNLRFEITVSDQLIDPVHAGLDLVFQIYPPVSDALIERRLFQHNGVFCAAPAYLQASAPLERPEDLTLHRFSRYSYYPWGDRWPLKRDNTLMELHLRPVLKTNSVHLLRDFVLSGAGVSYLPTAIVAEDMRKGRLVPLLQNYRAPQLWLSAVYPISNRSSTRLKTFLDFITKRFAAGYDSLTED